MKTFQPTKKQIEAFERVSRAIKSAQKKGLVFYGKSQNLVAYTEEADNYIEEDFEGSLATGFSQIPRISESGLLSDCGADDYGSYRSQEDEDNYS